MSDKESEESWTNPDYDRGMSRESHEQYMYRRNQEDNSKKGKWLDRSTCPKCGSVDSNVNHSEGYSYCFSCNVHFGDSIKEGTHEFEYGKATDKQVGGSHYKDCAIQPVDYIVENKLDFLEGNVVKYITRHKTKGGIEDIRKVIHYAELILEKKYGKDF